MPVLNTEQPAAKQAPAPLRVAALGFGAAVEEKVRLLLQQQSAGGQRYRLQAAGETGAEVLLVNYDNPQAVRAKDRLLGDGRLAIPVIAVSQMPLGRAVGQPPCQHIQGMLTAARLLAALAKVGAATASAAADAALPRYRALVVDDSLAVQKSLELKLSALPRIAAVDVAASGEQALAMAAGRHYDLVFLDVMMPGIDGYQTCAQLRALPAYKKTPVIMVSGKSSPLDEVKGVMAGCTTYLTKPVQEEPFRKLSARVLAWLDGRQNAAR